MRTRTIFEAHQFAGYAYRVGSYKNTPASSPRRKRLSRQIKKFSDELLRRMDRGDEWNRLFPGWTPEEIVCALWIPRKHAEFQEKWGKK